MNRLYGMKGTKYHYAVNARGASHVLQKKPCQDAFDIRYVKNGSIVVAAVADGVGSAAASEAGSLCAVRASVQHCADRLEQCTEEPSQAEAMRCIREAFHEALRAVHRHWQRNPQFDLRDFDTTLCLAVQCGTRLYWGQAGDGGLIAAFEDGTYEMLTAQQRDPSGRVFPLRFGERTWEFGAAGKPACSFLLATDGVLDNVFAPPILAKNWAVPIDRSQVRKFLHPRPGEEFFVNVLRAHADSFLRMRSIGKGLVDDRTLAVVCDARLKPRDQHESYYSAPNWERVLMSRDAKIQREIEAAARAACIPHAIGR